MFGYFGDILSRDQSLNVGEKYTFTFEFPWYSQYPSSASAIQFLSESLYGIANLVSASRSWFSENFVVTIIPTASLTLDEFIQAFVAAWGQAPWYVASPVFIQAEGGGVSTQPGGITQYLPSIGTTIGETAQQLIKPIFTYVLIGVAVYAGIKILPQVMAKRRAV